ncbi:MAG: TM1802 family CRISPR-associated protein [Syntrophomonadaceae bacterium]|jgi:CRISPR-associated protein Cas8b/Csh1 subtype I-B
MNLDFFAKFHDPYMQSPAGQGAFLAGVLLGYMAYRQAGQDGDISQSPLFKQIQFGRMDIVSLKRLLSRVPTLLAAYREDMKYTGLMSQLSATATELILQSGEEELGVNGNFALAAGFLNARSYFWDIFQVSQKDSQSEEGKEEA